VIRTPVPEAAIEKYGDLHSQKNHIGPDGAAVIGSDGQINPISETAIPQRSPQCELGFIATTAVALSDCRRSRVLRWGCCQGGHLKRAATSILDAGQIVAVRAPEKLAPSDAICPDDDRVPMKPAERSSLLAEQLENLSHGGRVPAGIVSARRTAFLARSGVGHVGLPFKGDTDEETTEGGPSERHRNIFPAADRILWSLPGMVHHFAALRGIPRPDSN
jgi:hypothetical protein